VTAIGLVHPGDMGAAVGAALVGTGHEVAWASAGRSPASAQRARDAGLRDAGDLATLAREVEIVISLVPPHGALDTARALGPFTGTYVDANAISPATAAQVAQVVRDGGATYVDGGVIGLPPTVAGMTRLYLSGAGAAAIAALFAGSPLDARVVAGDDTAASALKMHYAAWSKATTALLLTIRESARASGIEDALIAEWALSQPGLLERSEHAARSTARKGWRWMGEMHEIAATLRANDLPDGFHLAAAEVFENHETHRGPS
jgi:3-hydroxyisobutyrate dehydrogenase-like beta-hydroxyacid dehydrogenase